MRYCWRIQKLASFRARVLKILSVRTEFANSIELTLGRYGRGEAQHVAHVVIRAHLAVERRAPLTHVGARRSLDAVIALGEAEDRGSPRSLIGSWL